MSYAQKLLARDEQIVYEARQHWLAPLSDSLRPILLLLVGIILMGLQIAGFHPLDTVWTLLWVVLLVVSIVWIAIVVLTWRSEEYVITNRRVLKVEGLLDKKSGDSSLDKINDAVLKQGLLARMLGYGDLEILTANDDAIDRYQMLSHVVDFKKAMLNAKNYLEDGFAGRAPAPAPAAAGSKSSAAMSSDDVTSTLEKLAGLRDKGAITPAEYEAKKAELLGRL